MADERQIPFASEYTVTSDGHIYSRKRGAWRRLRPWLRNGYGCVTLRVGGISLREYVHRLVALVFIGPPPSNEHEVRHLDGNQTNCARDNLSWGTHTENMADMVRHGTQGAARHPDRMPRGDRHGSKTKPWRLARGERASGAKVTESDVRRIRALHAEIGRISAVARQLGVPRGVVKGIVQGKTWRHVA